MHEFRSGAPWVELRVKEWDDESSRSADGFKGRDYVHSSDAGARVTQYFLCFEPRDGTYPRIRLHGTVRMGPAAESHRGLCHGGSMTALMDDVVGWTGFCATGVCIPWSGFTAQINCKLCAPIEVGAELIIEGEIDRREGRKCFIVARLVSDTADEVVHATCEGLFIMSKEVAAAAAAADVGGDGAAAAAKRKPTSMGGADRS